MIPGAKEKPRVMTAEPTRRNTLNVANIAARSASTRSSSAKLAASNAIVITLSTSLRWVKLNSHSSTSLLAPQEWTGDSFVKSSLKKLGLRIQLNHLGNACSNPVPAHASFSVIHTNGIHEVALDYCGCRPVTKLRQLLRRSLYPSSQDNPRTCATFTLLRQMHLLSLTSKCSTYDYYRAIEKLTNNTGIKLPRSKYRPLLRMILQWRHLKLLKRGGRGHDATGAAGTKQGELAMLCPSCPHPGVNLPDDWKNATHAQRSVFAPSLYPIQTDTDADFCTS